jgi:hypothetical protein
MPDAVAAGVGVLELNLLDPSGEIGKRAPDARRWPRLGFLKKSDGAANNVEKPDRRPGATGKEGGGI